MPAARIPCDVGRIFDTNSYWDAAKLEGDQRNERHSLEGLRHIVTPCFQPVPVDEDGMGRGQRKVHGLTTAATIVLLYFRGAVVSGVSGSPSGTLP